MRARFIGNALMLAVVAGTGAVTPAFGRAAASPLRSAQLAGCGAGLTVLRAHTARSHASGRTQWSLPLTRSYLTPDGIRVRLRRMPSSVYALAVDGDTVVWAGRGNGPGNASNLYSADFQHFQPRVLAVGPPCSQFGDVRLSAHWIVWTEAAAHQPVVDVWALDRRTGRRYLVDAQWALQRFDCGGLACQPPLGISLDGDTVAWTDARLGRDPDVVQSTISIRTLPTGPSRNVVATRATCLMDAAPQLAGVRLVWLRFRWKAATQRGVPGNAHNCGLVVSRQVMTENLRSGAVQSLSRGPSAALPTTNGRYVAWQAGQCFLACYAGNITLADLYTGRRAIIAPSAVTSQRLTGRILIWRRDNHSNSAIMARDLPTGRRYSLAQARDVPNATVLDDPGWGSGRRVIWPERETAPDGSLVTYVAVANVP